MIKDGVVTTYTYNELNQITKAGDINYTWDNAGNLVSQSTDTGVLVASYTYDKHNRMISATVSNASRNIVETYTYDYLGNRTSKTSNGVTTEYTTDLSTGYSQILKAETGSKTVYYTRGFELISRREGSTASYYVYDGGLSVRALTDETGAVTDTLIFDAFGNETEKTGTTENPYGFQGEEQDATGLYYLRARYMDPSTGTFTTMDTYGGSLSDPMSLHKYLFANSNPVMNCDPSGNRALALEDTLAVVAVMTILAASFVYSIAMNNSSKCSASTNSLVNSTYYRDIQNLSDIKNFNVFRIGLLLIVFNAISKKNKDRIHGNVQWQADNTLSDSNGTLKPPKNKNKKKKNDNFKKVDEDYIREKTDTEPHEIKKETLGEKSKDISKFDIYENKTDKQLYIISKDGKVVKPTGYYIT